MSITFDGDNLFDSGPAHVRIGGRSLRYANEHGLGAAGAHLFSQGVAARSITQTGTLVADTTEQLQQQVDAIEGKLDGHPRTLVDHLGRAWSHVVMLKHEPAAFARLGTRWKVDYQIEYVQVRT